MPKRENEHAQMRREDYEAMEARGGGGGGDSFTPGFAKAPDMELQKRKILKAKRPTKPADADNEDAKPTGAFAGFSFAAPSSATTSGFSFGANNNTTTTPAAAATTTPTAASTGFSFLFGGNKAATTPAATPATTGGFLFSGSTPGPAAAASTAGAPAPFMFGKTPVSAPAPAPNNNSNNVSSRSSSGRSELCEKYQKHATRIEESFLKEVNKYDFVHADIGSMLDRYLDAVHCLENSYWTERQKVNDDNNDETAAAPAPPPFPFGAPAPAPAPSMFGTSVSAPAPLVFGAPAPASAPAPLVFGTPAPAAPGPSLFGAPAPGPSLFGAPAPAATTTTATTPAQPLFGGGAFPSFPNTPASTIGESFVDDGPSDTPAMANEPSELQEGDADADWDTVDKVDPGMMEYFRLQNGAFVKLCSGGVVKIQQKKNDKTIRRMIMRNHISGKVLLNIPLAPNMPFQVKTPSADQPPRKVQKDRVIFVTKVDEGEKEETLLMSKKVAPGDPKLGDLMAKWLDFKA